MLENIMFLVLMITGSFPIVWSLVMLRLAVAMGNVDWYILLVVLAFIAGLAIWYSAYCIAPFALVMV